MLIRVSDCQQVARKNGGGATREIAVFPPGAGIADFTWRLSSARVEKPGAFSRFDGIDRTIAILKGTLLLEVEGQVPRHLTSHSPPYAFPGHLATSGAPVGGEVLDLNLMARRGAGWRKDTHHSSRASRNVHWRVIHLPRQETLLIVGNREILMQAHDVYELTPADLHATISQGSVTRSHCCLKLLG